MNKENNKNQKKTKLGQKQNNCQIINKNTRQYLKQKIKRTKHKYCHKYPNCMVNTTKT